ncbi:isochorismatase family protein [Kordiimonas sp.]|uniref:isochorismatase family protein n=1 Tax=Kordiimonas sp. TaxID=1970157 RepID=UPI003A95378B
MDLQRKSLKLGARPALILVDMINGFTDPSSPLGVECPDVVTANAKLLQVFRDQGLPVVFTTTLYRAPGEASVFRARVPALNILQPGSRWAEVDARLLPCSGEPVVEKKWASAFFGTDLSAHLIALKADSLVVTGLTTSGCVRATAVDGLQYNYPVFIPREAVGDRNQDAHHANLHDLHAKYADVIALQDLLAALRRSA